MYCKFYGFKQLPFNVTSDPEFFFFSQKHKEALSHLFYGVTQRKGIIAITGEIGTGKTTLCRFFIERLDSNTKTAFILNPYFPEIQLLEEIIRDFGIRKNPLSAVPGVWKLNRFLLKEFKRGRNIVLIIDEAQNLTPVQLEQIRLLSNLETKKDKLLQIVLVGQPELNHKLNSYALRQLQQRIAVKYHITPLNKDEVISYIKHRLNIAQTDEPVKFTDEAFQAITDLSCCTPRLINHMCDRALLAGFIAETKTIDLNIVKMCAEDLKNEHYI